MSDRTVLVTGASGFLGSHVCEVVHSAGYRVQALVRRTSSRRWLDHDWLGVRVADIADRDALARSLADVDEVVHCAGSLWGDYQQTNAAGTEALADACVRAGVGRLVYASSLAAAGPCSGPFPRDPAQPDAPTSPYGRSKKAGEDALRRVADRLRVVILRFPMIYGPRDTQGLRLFRNLRCPVSVVVGFRPIYISAVHVRDAARAACRALQADVPSGSCFGISDGTDFTFDDIYALVGDALGRTTLRLPMPFPLVIFGAWLVHDVLGERTAFNPDQIAMFRSPYWLVDPGPAAEKLGWRAEVPIREGIRETLRWYREHRWL